MGILWKSYVERFGIEIKIKLNQRKGKGHENKRI